MVDYKLNNKYSEAFQKCSSAYYRSQMPSLAARKDFQQLLQAITGETVTVRPDSNITEFPNFTLHVSDRNIRPQTYRNSFDIPRKELLDQLVRMRTNFLQLALSKSARFMNEGVIIVLDFFYLFFLSFLKGFRNSRPNFIELLLNTLAISANYCEKSSL